MPSSKCPLFVLPQEDAERGIRIQDSLRQLAQKASAAGNSPPRLRRGVRGTLLSFCKACHDTVWLFLRRSLFRLQEDSLESPRIATGPPTWTASGRRAARRGSARQGYPGMQELRVERQKCSRGKSLAKRKPSQGCVEMRAVE